jgi:tetratricopeptide (TPR) repeat protein
LAQQQAGTRFVGRDRELRELLDALDEAASGRGRLILLGGEPGIGKSRLADELASRARERGIAVLWGRGWEDAGAPPYWLWVQALRGYLRATLPDEVRQHMGAGAADLGQMLPELRDMYLDLPIPRDTGSDSARFQLFDSTATLLRNAARDGPMLIVLDDLQAADTPSILLLRFLASQLVDMPLLVVGTYRDVELTPDAPLTDAVAEIARQPSTRMLALSGLGEAPVGQFIQSAAGVTPGPRLAAALVRETGGNPLFLGEAVRLLAAEGRLDEVAATRALHLPVPRGIRDVIGRRMRHLPDATVEALVHASAIGPEFSAEVLRRVGGERSGDLLDQLGDATRAGLITVVPGALDRYRFAHDLIRETLYDGLAPAPRARLHLRIAESLETLYGAAPDAHLAELAHHFFEACRGGDGSGDGAGTAVDRAASYAREAGDQALRSLAFEEAARLHRMALAVLEHRGPETDAARLEVLLRLGDAEARGGDLPTSRETFLVAADLARRTGAAEALASAALGYGGRFFWARVGFDPHLIPMLQDALVMLGGRDDGLRVRLLTRLACAWRNDRERQEQRRAMSQQAIDMARMLGDPADLSYALAGFFWAAWVQGNVDERLAVATEVLEVAEAAGDAERAIDAHFMLFLVLMDLGRVREARTRAESVARLAVELRQPAQLWLTWAYRTVFTLLEGDYRRAEEAIAQEAEQEKPTTPVRDDVSGLRMHRFLLRREQGRVAEEEANVRASVEEFPWYPMHRSALACLLLDTGRIDEAAAVLDEMAVDEFRMHYPDCEWMLGVPLASEACAALGNAQAAETLYRQLLPFAGGHAVGHPEGSVGAVDRYLGLLARTRGDLDAAVAHLEAAITVNESMGARPWAAHSRHDLAEVLGRRDQPGDRQRADELDRAARATAVEIGMALANQIVTAEPNDAPEVRVRRADQPGASTAPEPASASSFIREGEYWTIEFGGRTLRVRDSRGMRHLSRLLQAPGQEVHALDLAREDGSRPTPGAGERFAQEDQLSGDGLGDAGAALDDEAKAAYRERLTSIREELAEAEAWNDPERVVRLQVEEQALAHELAGALGLGGRDRPIVSAAERARVSVTRAIRAALAKIAEQDRALGDHLEATVRTGTFCSYVPDPRAPIRWRL